MTCINVLLFRISHFIVNDIRKTGNVCEYELILMFDNSSDNQRNIACFVLTLELNNIAQQKLFLNCLTFTSPNRLLSQIEELGGNAHLTSLVHELRKIYAAETSQHRLALLARAQTSLCQVKKTKHLHLYLFFKKNMCLNNVVLICNGVHNSVHV